VSDFIPPPDPTLSDFREWFGVDVDFVDFSMEHEELVPFIEYTLTLRHGRASAVLYARRYYPIDLGGHAFFKAWGRHHQDHGWSGVFEYRIK
jgi:hypothetical protein